MMRFCLSLAACPVLTVAAGPHPEVASKQEFLENGKVKIGVDLSSGGSIFWFSSPPAGPNLLNHADRGRFIQQSYYGKKDGSMWAKKPWRWNPVQGGDYKGKPAKLLETKRGKDFLFVKSVPVNWAGGQDLTDCTMEETIRLEGDMAGIRFQFRYDGKEAHPPTHQELPAVFMDFAFTDLVYYKGKAPWTGAALSKDRPGWPNEGRQCDEEWAAYVGPDGRGLGVYFPGSNHITCYRHPGPAGPKGGGCAYFAPIRTMAITPGFQFEYRVFLSTGTPEEMRARFGQVRENLAKPEPGK